MWISGIISVDIVENLLGSLNVSLLIVNKFVEKEAGKIPASF
jgi:hypothetical protein